MEVFFSERNDLARPRWPKEQTILLFTLTRIYSDKWPALVATTCSFSRRSLSKTLTDFVQLCIVQCSKSVCWGLQISKVCCIKWKKISITTTGKKISLNTKSSQQLLVCVIIFWEQWGLFSLAGNIFLWLYFQQVHSYIYNNYILSVWFLWPLSKDAYLFVFFVL